MNYKPLLILLVFNPFFFAQAKTTALQNTGVNVQPRVYLQGALHGLLPAATLMRDNLRALGLLPSTEPYTSLGYHFWNHGIDIGGGETLANPNVLQVTGSNAIVDWVIVELRSTSFLDSIKWSRAALVQRDGDVVDVDGISPVNFPNANPGEYRVMVRHRNHLGIMSDSDIALSTTPVTVDFTDIDTQLACPYGMTTIGNKRALWGGDLNMDGRLIYQGPGNDILKLFTTVLYDSANTSLITSFVSTGYLQADANMDGKAIYQGPNSDRTFVFQFIGPAYNFNFGNNYVVLECVP